MCGGYAEQKAQEHNRRVGVLYLCHVLYSQDQLGGLSKKKDVENDAERGRIVLKRIDKGEGGPLARGLTVFSVLRFALFHVLHVTKPSLFVLQGPYTRPVVTQRWRLARLIYLWFPLKWFGGASRRTVPSVSRVSTGLCCPANQETL